MDAKVSAIVCSSCLLELAFTNTNNHCFTEAKEGLQPDSTKSTTDKIGETITDAGDKVSRGVVPDSQKSTGQSMTDKAGRSKDQATSGGSGGGIIDNAKNALGMGEQK